MTDEPPPEKIPCPECDRQAWDFCIVGGKCDKCRSEAERAAMEPYQLSLDDIRDERNRRLAACDWTQVADAQVDQAAWAAYRQALRDMPETVTDPASITWPDPPS